MPAIGTASGLRCRSASASAASSTSPPRAVLISTAPGFIARTISSLVLVGVLLGFLVGSSRTAYDALYRQLQALDDGPAKQALIANFGFSELQAQAIIERELGAPIGEVFSEFEAVPLGSASIGQVHKATWKDGRTVAVNGTEYSGEEFRKALARDPKIASDLCRQLYRLGYVCEKLGKKQKALQGKVETTKLYPLGEALALVVPAVFSSAS